MLSQKVLAYLHFAAAAIFVFLAADFIGKKVLLENFFVLLVCFMTLTLFLGWLLYKESKAKK